MLPLLEKLSYLISYKIVSAKDRTLKSEIVTSVNDRKVNIRLHDVLDPTNLKLKPKFRCKYYLTSYAEKPNRKLLIIFPGRTMELFQADNSFYVEHFYRTKMLDNFDLATIIYPERATHIDQLTYHCLLAVNDLITRHNYSVSDISILGWSLGGYLSIETLRKFFDMNPHLDEKFECFIHNKSFTNVKDFLENLVPETLQFVFEIPIVKRYSLIWNADSCESFMKIQDKIKNIYVIYSNEDKVVKGSCHFYTHIKNDTLKNVIIREDDEYKSHYLNWKLTARLLNESTKSANFTDISNPTQLKKISKSDKIKFKSLRAKSAK